MKTTADARWDRLAAALLATRDAWRSILQRPAMTTLALRELAQAESSRITQVFETSAPRPEAGKEIGGKKMTYNKAIFLLAALNAGLLITWVILAMGSLA